MINCFNCKNELKISNGPNGYFACKIFDCQSYWHNYIHTVNNSIIGWGVHSVDRKLYLRSNSSPTHTLHYDFDKTELFTNDDSHKPIVSIVQFFQYDENEIPKIFDRLKLLATYS